MFTALRQLQVQGTQAAFINYVVCLAVVQGIKQATQHLLPVSNRLQLGCLQLDGACGSQSLCVMKPACGWVSMVLT